MNQTRKITGHTVLVGMMCFFGVIFAVNGVFVYFALGSWPGLSYDNAYRRGLEYNTVLEAAEAQSRLGWQSRLAQRSDDHGNKVLDVIVSDRNGVPVRRLDVMVDLRRPTHAEDDFTVRAVERPAGQYFVNVGPERTGYWQVEIRATAPNGKSYAMTHEVEIVR